MRQNWADFAGGFFQGFGTTYLLDGPSIPESPVKVLDDEDDDQLHQ